MMVFYKRKKKNAINSLTLGIFTKLLCEILKLLIRVSRLRRTLNALRWSKTSCNTSARKNNLDQLKTSTLHFDKGFKSPLWWCQCLLASILSCSVHYYSQSILLQSFLFHLVLSVLTPSYSDGEVPQEVAELTFLTESLFKLNLNDPLSS